MVGILPILEQRLGVILPILMPPDLAVTVLSRTAMIFLANLEVASAIEAVMLISWTCFLYLKPDRYLYRCKSMWTICV